MNSVKLIALDIDGTLYNKDGVITSYNKEMIRKAVENVITILISFITLIFGELVPKRIALQKAEWYSMFCAKPVLADLRHEFLHVLLHSFSFLSAILAWAFSTASRMRGA